MAQSNIGPPGRPKRLGLAQTWWDIQDIVGEASLWPNYIRHLFWRKNLTWEERQIISAFVFINGLNPIIFLEWVTLKGLARDDKAWRHFKYILGQFEKNPTLYHYGLYAYNITMGYYQKPNGQRHTYCKR